MNEFNKIDRALDAIRLTPDSDKIKPYAALNEWIAGIINRGEFSSEVISRAFSNTDKIKGLNAMFEIDPEATESFIISDCTYTNMFRHFAEQRSEFRQCLIDEFINAYMEVESGQ